MEILSKHKRVFIITLVVICFILIILSVTYRKNSTFIENALAFIIIPAQEVTGNTSRWVVDKVTFLKNMKDIEDENILLKDEISQLKAENIRLRLIEDENKKLSDLLDIDQKYPNYEKTGARIVSKSMGNWYNDFRINKGKNDAIEKNMVVLGGGGLVGRVFSTMDSSSTVISLIDPMSSVHAKGARTDDYGFVKGNVSLMQKGLCRMEDIDINAEIMEGDEIVTSNLGNIYPPGITIGYVKEVGADINGFTKYAIIQPLVDFKHLESVLIINETFDNDFEKNNKNNEE